MSQQIIIATIEDGGRVDVQVRGSGLDIEQYGRVIGTVIRIAANLFSDTGEIKSKDAISELLKAANREAYSTQAMNVFRGSVQ